MSQTFMSMSTAALKEHGSDKAMAELQRRSDKGSRYAAAALEELGATVNINGKPAAEPTTDNPQLDAILALLGQLGVPTDSLKAMKADASPAPAKPKSKKKPKKSNTTTITGANIERTRDDNGWTWECKGVWDKDTQSVDDQHLITGHTGTGATNDEAKAAFFAPFREQGIYLARPYYNDVKDYRTNPLADVISKATVDTALAPAEMSREQLKAVLGLPESCSKRTSTLVNMVAKQNHAHEDATDTTEQVKRGIANLLEKYGK